MEENTYQHTMDIARYTFFVVNIACVIFVAAVYGFAFKFLDNKFYRTIAIGWVTNAIYLTLETYFFILNDTKNDTLSYIILTISLLSTLIFHYAINRDEKFLQRVKFIARFKPLYGLIPITLCVIGMIYASNAAYDHKFWFSLFLMPTILYSFIILSLISYRFFISFPDDEFGLSSTILYGSWGIYGVIQFYYPLAIFNKEIETVQTLSFSIFVLAFVLKILNIIGLLNVLQKEYSNLQGENLQYSVHQEVGELAAGLHHDIKLPSALIDGELTLLETDKPNDARIKAFIKPVRKANKMISETVKLVDMIQLDPKQISQRFKKLHVGTLISSARGFYNRAIKENSLKIVKSEQPIPTAYVFANEELLTQAFFNIMKNAKESLATLLEIQVQKSDTNPKNIEFLFFNNGEIISDDEMDNCFRAGWSSEKKRERRADEGNVGMGLYMCFRIIAFHRGKIEIFRFDEASKSNKTFKKEEFSKYKVGVRITLPIASN